jgi:hypothetical protein
VTGSRFQRVLFATEPDGAFQAAGRSWRTLDLDRVRKAVGDAGYETTVVRVDRLLETEFRETDLLFYTSAYSPELRAYIREILYFVRERVTIAPRYELMLAHENKGVQELLKHAWRFGNLEGSYHVDFDETSLERPYVFKTATGAGSSGVHLVRGRADEQRIRRRHFATPLTRRLKLLQRKAVLGAAQLRRYAYYYKSFRPFVRQRFVEGLAGDMKVLVFGERYYSLWRDNRPGDFRASGSGRLDFDRPCPDGALDFARDIAARLDSPFLSLDIAQSAAGFHLIEFQALNFGPTTLTGSTGYYVERDGAGWERIGAEPDLEEAFAHAMLHYLERHHPVEPRP